MIIDDEIEAHNLPSGIIFHMHREAAAGAQSFCQRLALTLSMLVADQIWRIDQREPEIFWVVSAGGYLEEFLQLIIHMPRYPLTAVRFGVSSLVVRPPIGSQPFFTRNRRSSLRGFSCTLLSAAVVRWFCDLWSYAGNAWPCGSMADSERRRSDDFHR